MCVWMSVNAHIVCEYVCENVHVHAWMHTCIWTRICVRMCMFIGVHNENNGDGNDDYIYIYMYVLWTCSFLAEILCSDWIWASFSEKAVYIRIYAYVCMLPWKGHGHTHTYTPRVHAMFCVFGCVSLTFLLSRTLSYTLTLLLSL